MIHLHCMEEVLQKCQHEVLDYGREGDRGKRYAGGQGGIEMCQDTYVIDYRINSLQPNYSMLCNTLIISKLIYSPNPCFQYKASAHCFLITLFSSSAVSRVLITLFSSSAVSRVLKAVNYSSCLRTLAKLCGSGSPCD